jgi:hypothetical protein
MTALFLKARLGVLVLVLVLVLRMVRLARFLAVWLLLLRIHVPSSVIQVRNRVHGTVVNCILPGWLLRHSDLPFLVGRVPRGSLLGRGWQNIGAFRLPLPGAMPVTCLIGIITSLLNRAVVVLRLAVRAGNVVIASVNLVVLLFGGLFDPMKTRVLVTDETVLSSLQAVGRILGPQSLLRPGAVALFSSSSSSTLVALAYAWSAVRALGRIPVRLRWRKSRC